MYMSVSKFLKICKVSRIERNSRGRDVLPAGKLLVLGKGKNSVMFLLVLQSRFPFYVSLAAGIVRRYKVVYSLFSILFLA